MKGSDKREMVIKRENHSSWALCSKCDYSITEPICDSCVFNEIKVWFYEQKIKKDILKAIDIELKILSKKIESMDYVILSSNNFYGMSTIKCIKCKKEMNLICYYCVINLISQIVENNLVNESSIESFNEHFNTNIYDNNLINKNKLNLPSYKDIL